MFSQAIAIRGYAFSILGAVTSMWSSQLSSGVGQVWELMYVAALGEGSQTQNSVCTLQTTSRTRLRMLAPTCDVASEILKRVPSDDANSSNLVSDLSIVDLVSNKRSGTFKVKAAADSIEFILPDASKLSLRTTVTLLPEEIVERLCQAVYVGCESCSQPLPQDDNGVYCQCVACMMKSPGVYPASSYFFRPLFVVISDGSLTTITLTASQVVVPKVEAIFQVLGFTARDTVQASLSNKKPEVIQMRRLRELFGPAHWLINCLDENSFVQEISFSIIDVALP